jgi:hypothetical protein
VAPRAHTGRQRIAGTSFLAMALCQRDWGLTGTTMTTVSFLGDRFRDAFVYAASLHEGQRRKGTCIPYIAHPLAVASLVPEAGGTESEAIAALLHDCPEDCGGYPGPRGHA